VRFLILPSLIALALVVATIKGTAGARAGGPVHRPGSMKLAMLRRIADHYRQVTWTYQRAAKKQRTRSTLSYRHSPNPRYLEWVIGLWQERADDARASALTSVQRIARISLPSPPLRHASIVKRIAYHRAVTWRLQTLYPGRRTLGSDAFRKTRSDAYRRWALHVWQRRAANAAFGVATHVDAERARSLPTRVLSSNPLASSFMCIHRYEGAWDSNTGNGYYGGLQMDWSFMRSYGGDFVTRWGTADNWPVWAQIEAAARAHRSGRGFTPWPNTARYCGLL
jgi:hypothetical protein